MAGFIHLPHSLDELHEDLLLGNGNSDHILVGQDGIILSVVDIEHSELAVGVAERSSLNQLTVGVSVDSSTGIQLLRARHLEGTSELHSELSVLGLLGDTKHARKLYTSVEHDLGGTTVRVLTDVELIAVVRAKIEVVTTCLPRSIMAVDDVGGVGDGNIVRPGKFAEHQAETAFHLVLIEDGEGVRVEHTNVKTLVALDSASRLQLALGTEGNGVALFVEVDHNGMDTAIDDAGEDHHHTGATDVVHIEEVVRKRPGQGDHIASSDDVAGDSAQASTHVVVSTSGVVTSDGDDEVIVVQTSHTVESVAIEHGEGLRHGKIGSLALSLPASHTGLHPISVLVDEGEGGVGDVINVRILVIIVGKGVGRSEEEVHGHDVVLTLHIHSQRKKLLVSDHDELVVGDSHNIIQTLDVHGHRVDLSSITLPGVLEGRHSTIISDESHHVVEVTHLHMLHGVVEGFSRNIAVDGGSSTRVSISISVNRDGHSRGEGDKLGEIGEIIAVELALDHILLVMAKLPQPTLLHSPRLTQLMMKADRTRIPER